MFWSYLQARAERAETDVRRRVGGAIVELRLGVFEVGLDGNHRRDRGDRFANQRLAALRHLEPLAHCPGDLELLAGEQISPNFLSNLSRSLNVTSSSSEAQ